MLFERDNVHKLLCKILIDLKNYDDPEGLFTEIRNMYYDDFDKPEPHTH